jgi:hypothetical protein
LDEADGKTVVSHGAQNSAALEFGGAQNAIGVKKSNGTIWPARVRTR